MRKEKAMEQTNLTIEDLAKKLDIIRTENRKLDSQNSEAHNRLYRERAEILQLIKESAHAVMVKPGEDGDKGWYDNYKKEVASLQAKIMKDEAVSKLLGKIRIEDVALVETYGESLVETDGMGNKSDFYTRPIMIGHPYRNAWHLNISYLHGGPMSPAKVFYRKGDNGHNYICGVLVSESSKVKKGQIRVKEEIKAVEKKEKVEGEDAKLERV